MRKNTAKGWSYRHKRMIAVNHTAVHFVLRFSSAHTKQTINASSDKGKTGDKISLLDPRCPTFPTRKAPTLVFFLFWSQFKLCFRILQANFQWKLLRSTLEEVKWFQLSHGQPQHQGCGAVGKISDSNSDLSKISDSGFTKLPTPAFPKFPTPTP